MGYPHVILAIGQLVEHLTVDCAEIRWSLPGSIPGGRTALPLQSPASSAVSLPIVLASQGKGARRLVSSAGKPYRLPPCQTLSPVHLACPIPLSAQGREADDVGTVGPWLDSGWPDCSPLGWAQFYASLR